jgi:hypothetical protein
MRAVLIALLLSMIATIAHADSSVEATPEPRPLALQKFMARVRMVAAAHDAGALAKLVDRGFTIGEELPRSYSLSAIRAKPSVLDELVTVIDTGHCEVDEVSAQCFVHIAGAAPNRRTFVAFVRERGRWRLGAFAPTAEL